MIPRKNTAKDLWKPKRRIEVRYRKALKQVLKKMNITIKDLNTEYEITKALKKLANSSEFKRYAESISMNMITSLFSDSGKTWREAARSNSKGREIFEALKKELKGPIGGAVNEQIQLNANLIKSMPLDIAKEMTDYTAKETYKGNRSEDIAYDLQKKFEFISEKKANLIARTEVSKASTELTRARSENLGIRWYIWRTSEDVRVRSSHSHMEGVLICWDNPPSPEKLLGIRSSLGYYHAGECPNCRCYPEAVVSLDFVKWPCKVYYNGTIESMTRKQFEEIAA